MLEVVSHAVDTAAVAAVAALGVRYVTWVEVAFHGANHSTPHRIAMRALHCMFAQVCTEGSD